MLRAFVLLVALLAFGGGGPARAQESGAAERPTLTMGWVPVPPFFETETDGSRTGFSYELGVLLAEELGAAFEIRDYAAITEYYQAQNSGETDFAPGISAAPSLAERNVFSNPVAESRVGLFVLAERAASIDPATVAGLKIATFPYGPGSDVDEVVSRNINVPFNSTLEAIFALLSGKVDAILSAQTAIFVPAYAARVDHRIVAVGAPLQKYGRSVVLHRSRADMLAPMNAAIAKLEEDGRLQALRRKYFLEQLLPLPDVLTVGVAHSPPYGIIEPDGSFSGFAVEFFRDLADEAGIKIKFVAQTLDEYFEGPGYGRPDAFPLYIVSDDLRDRMDFTNPTRMTPFSTFTLASNDDIRAIEDLAGQRVGLKPDTIDVALANGFGDARLVSIAEDHDLLQALLDGDVAAITDAPEVIRKQVRTLGVQDAVREVQQISFAVQGAIVLRFGLGEIRERLNAQLPVYLISEQYRELRARYFGPRTFWTPRMQVYARIAAWSGVVAFILLGSFTYLSVRARRQAEALTRETVSISNRLNAVLNAAQSGIIGLDSEGRVMIANPEARHMLGGISDPVPFNWPENVAFLDSEHMHPLDASEDPLRRAVLGHRLRGIITLMTRPGVVDPRYVRLTSARIAEQQPGSVRTVLVIDDVSEQEKNRQQFERASRLDALGQLTGGIAHDFNNVLATIQYAVQLAQMRATDERVVSYLSRAVGSVERGAELTRRLLAFAKRQPGLAKSVPVEHVFEEFAALARPTIEEHVTLDFVADDDDLWVYCDAAQLENALLNIVINSRDAIIASGRGDQIVVRARGVSEIDADRLLRKETPHSYIAKGLHAEHAESRAEGGERAYRYIEFAVTDNGPGMSDEVKRRAIDPFFTTKDASSGTGLGLSMVYGFVQQANGELRIYSEVDHGTTVRVLLPRGTNDGQRERPVARMPVPTGEGQRIFIVEDEDDLRMTMSEVVESLGYQALMASSGREALEMVKKGERFDVLLTDVVMPGGVGGFELAREVRALMPHMPVIYMSGYTGFSDEEMGEVVAPLIQKPCPPFELGEALEKALGT